MHAEFITHYEKQLLEPFGLTGYGCCEDLSHKLDSVITIPHIEDLSLEQMALNQKGSVFEETFGLKVLLRKG